VLAGTIRLAEQLERSRDQTVTGVQVASENADGGAVQIEPDAPADADVAIWSARRNADLLERALDRELQVAPGR
jgi:hypothetical protein